MSLFKNKNSLNYHAKRLEQHRSPTAGRTRQENTRIRRHCLRFADNLLHLHHITNRQQMPWFPVDDVVTDRDDESIIDWRAVTENMVKNGYQTDDSGLLVNMQDEGITASNRIEAVLVYRRGDEEGNPQDYMIRKTLFSPFLCDEWGFLPLTIHQWSIIAMPMILTRSNWQWCEAVNAYARRNELPDGYTLSYIVGWNLVTPRKPSRQRQREDAQDRQVWTGHIIYSLATSTNFAPITTVDGFPE